MIEALLKLPQVCAMTHLSTSVIYQRMNAGTFPPARQVGKRAVAWLQSEIVAWMAALPPTTRDTRRDSAPDHVKKSELNQRAA